MTRFFSYLTRSRSRALAGLAAALVSISSFAEPTTFGPSFQQAMEAAWQRLPTTRTLNDQQLALQQRPADWLLSAPILAVDYQQGDDSSGLAAEWQAQLELPLTRPDQLKDRQRLFRIEDQQRSQQSHWLRWRLSGQLQDWWWQYQQASERLARFQQQHQALTTQLAWLDLLIQQGERPAFDRLELQQQLQQQQMQTQLLEARQLTLRTQFQQWTGFSQLPEQWHFSRATAVPLAQHPALMYREHQLQQARLSQSLSHHSSLSPTLSLGVKRVESVNATPETHVVQLGVSVPLGDSGYQTRKEHILHTGAQEQQLLMLHQQLERERRVLEQQLPKLAHRADVMAGLSEDAHRQYQQQHQSWRDGGLPGFRWLQIQRSLWQLQQQADEAVLDYQHNISRWNQLQGVIPQ